MNEHSIIFNDQMVRATLEGRKTQTRRVLKPQLNPKWTGTKWVDAGRDGIVHWVCKCPYGQPGDRLWVRESYHLCNVDEDHAEIIYAASDEKHRHSFIDLSKKDLQFALEAMRKDAVNHFLGYHPSTHMFRWASRITLEVVSVRVERVQDISNKDAWSEGCTAYSDREYWKNDLIESVVLADTPRDEFQTLWDSIYAKRGYGWDANPFVWVIEFKLAEQ